MSNLKMYACGYNGFGQFGADLDEILYKFTPIDLEKLFKVNGIDLKCVTDVKCGSSWFFNAFGINNCLYIFGIVGSENRNFTSHSFNSEIKDLSVSDCNCLILLNTGELYQFNCDTNVVKKINILGGTTKILHAAAGSSVMIAADDYQRVHNFASQVEEIGHFERPNKIKKIKCGREHSLILTTNGDVYSYGNGIRGQLGKDELESSNGLSLLEALGGVKMLDIAAGAWCGLALSAFGDVYTWGWNVHGMMGQRVSEKSTLKYGDGSTEDIEQKCAAVFATPHLIELHESSTSVANDNDGDNDNSVTDDCRELQIRQVFCGSKHTVLITTCGQILVAGWNEYGQLGVGDESVKLVDKFKSIDFRCDVEKLNVICGHWSTIFILK